MTVQQYEVDLWCYLEVIETIRILLNEALDSKASPGLSTSMPKTKLYWNRAWAHDMIALMYEVSVRRLA